VHWWCHFVIESNSVITTLAYVTPGLVASDFVVPVSFLGLNDIHLLHKLSLFHDVMTKFDRISVFSREV